MARSLAFAAASLLAVCGILASTDSHAQSGRLLQVATRGQVLTGDDVMIAGLIVAGPSPKTVIITAAGPSLASQLAFPLRDPKLTLVRQSDGAVLKTNDNWQVQAVPADAAAIEATGMQPIDALEPAIIATLPPGAYTAIVSGAGETTGVATVAVTEVDHPEVPLINLSTRARVLTGENVMIAGFAIGPLGPREVVITATGPSLFGRVKDELQNPSLTLVRMSDRAVIATNDDWQVQSNPADVARIEATGLQPTNPREAAIIATLQPGLYTAVVTGMGVENTGVGLVSVNQASRDVAITSAGSTTFTVGAAGTFTVTTEGYPPATGVTATGALPAGVTFTPGTINATLAGTPAAGTGGTYPLTITASNGNPPDAVQSFTLTVNQAPAITSADAATFNVGIAGTHTVVATGFPAPTLSMTGSLPAGVTFNAATGALSGTPAAGTAGTYSVTITADNGVVPGAAQNFTLTITDNVTITSANAATFTVGQAGTFTITTSGTPVANSITVPGLPPGLAVSATTPTGTATISGTPSGPAGVFPLTITASNGGVTPNGTQNFTLTLLAQAQTISFTSVAPVSPVALGPTYNVSATATSGLAVTFTIDTSATGVCSIAGSTVSFLAAGTCVINANQAGDGNYLAAPQVQQSMVVGKASQTVTITTAAPGAAVVAGPTYGIAATAAPSGLPVTFSTTTPAICTAAGSTISFIGAGSCTVVATQAGNATYNAASANQTFAVAKASQTITFTSVAPVPASVGGPTYGVTATATSGLPVAFTIDAAASAVCTIAGSTVSFIGVGNCIVNANQAGNANYNAAPQVQQTFPVKNSQTITITSAPPANPVVGGNYAVTATASSGLGVILTSGSPGVCTNAGALFSFIGVGTCIINANQPGDANYFPAPQAQQSFAVNQVPAITSTNTATFFVGTFGTFTVTTTGFPTPAVGGTGALPTGVLFADNGDGTGTLSGTPAAGTAGNYPLTFSANNGVPPTALQPFVLAVVDPAVANNDAYALAHDTVLTVSLPGFLANDSGSPTPTLTSVTGTGAPCTVFPCTIATANGSVTAQSTGAFTYTPAPGFTGTNSFTYSITNPAGSSSATVTLAVDNVAPVVDLDGAATGGIDIGPVAFTEGGGPVAIVGTINPNWLTVTDADNTTAASATIVLTNLQDAGAETLSVCPDPAPGCSGAIQLADVVSTTAPGTFTITITKVAALTDYEELLRSLEYNNTSSNPTVLPVRDVTVAVSDGFATSSPLAHATVSIIAVNNAPVLAAIEGAALAFSVGGSAAPVTSTLTVADVDSPNLLGATVSITGNCVNSDDVLAFTDQNGITGSYSSATCVLALTGSSSLANYQAALRSVTYNNTNLATSTATRTVSFQANDGGAANNLSNVATRNITVAVNGAPTLNAGGTLNYTENDPPTAIDNTVTVVDGDSPNLVGATIQITANCMSSEDILAFSTQNGISGVYSAGTCLMTLTGISSVANYQAALRSVQYSNSSEKPSTLARTVTWRVNDGGAINNLSNQPTSTINVAATGDAPVLVAGATATFTEDGPAVVIDGGITVTDVDSTNLVSATVQITGNCSGGEDVLAFTSQNGIAGSYTAGTCLLTLTGSATLGNYELAFRSITYANTSQNPSTAARTVTWIGNDGVLSSAGVTSTVNVVAVNDAPVLSNLEVAALAYTENGPPLAISGTLAVNDVDSANLVGATIQITGNCAAAEDVLSFTTQNGITGTYTPATCLMTLNGTSSLANYQAAIRSVAYANSSDNPSTAARTLSVQVNDGGAVSNLSNTVTRGIAVTAVNDPPVATAFAGLPAQAGIPITYPAGKLGGTDPEGTTVTIDTTPINVTNGTVTLNANGGFTFTPLPLAATASFQYRVVDSGSPLPAQNSPYVTVSFTVSGPAIHFVKSSPVGLGNCTLGNECTFATADTNIGANTGAVIFISDADSHTVSATLPANTQVFGQGVTTVQTFDEFFGIGAPAQGTLATRPNLNQGRPTLTSAGTTLTVGSNSTLRGFNFGNATVALAGTSFGTLTLADMLFNTNGQAMSLATGTLDATLGSVTSTGGAHNVVLDSVATAGTVNLGGGALSGATGNGLVISNANGSFSYGGNITNSNGFAVQISGKTGGAVSLSGSINPGGGAGGRIFVTNNSSGTNTIAFSGTVKKVSSGANDGVTLATNTGATIDFTNGGLEITTTSGTGFSATGGAAAVNVTGTGNFISSTSGTALNVTSTNIGSGDMTFRSISSNGGSSTGIILDTTGTSGSLVVTGTGSAGSGGTIANKAGVNGQTNSGIGIYLKNTTDPSFSWMQLNDLGNYAIRGFLVNGFTLANSVVNGTNGTVDQIGLAASPEGSIAFGSGTGEFDGAVNGLIGTATISNTSVSGAFSNNIRVVNQSGLLNRLTLDTVTIGANSAANGNDGVVIEPQGSATIRVTVNASTFTSSRGDLLQYVDNSTVTNAAQDVVITNSTFSNNHGAISTGGGGVTINGGVANDLTLNITGSSFRDAVGPGVLIVKPTGPRTLSGTFANNTIGVGVVANSGSAEGSALKVQTVGQGTLTLAITNNTISQYNNYGIELLAGGGASAQSGAFNTTITGNTIELPGNTAGTLVIPKNGIHLNIGTVPSDTFAACSAISNNTVHASGVDSSPPSGVGDIDIRLRQRQATTIRLPGYTGANNDNPAVQTFVAGNNNVGGTPVALAANTVPTGGGFVGTGTTCP